MSTHQPDHPAAGFPPDEPSDLEEQPDDSTELSDLEYEDMPCTDDADDSRWEAFIPDDDEVDPQPGPGDFWIESHVKPGLRASEPRCGAIACHAG